VLLVHAADASAEEREDQARGWAFVMCNPLETAVSPGDHYTMVSEPHVEALAALLDRAFQDVTR
jgi:thioesterase domain-containing protein